MGFRNRNRLEEARALFCSQIHSPLLGGGGGKVDNVIGLCTGPPVSPDGPIRQPYA
jgi:hypothetical protein